MKSARIALTMAGTVILATVTAASVTAEGPGLPDAPGKVQVTESCMQCHGVDLIVARNRSGDEWSQVVSQMVGYGATLTDDQYKIIVTYLSKNLGEQAAKDGAAPTSPKRAPS